MALTIAKIADIQYIPSTTGSIYENPASTKMRLKGLIIFNGNTTDETVKLYNVPGVAGAAGTASGANQFFQCGIPAGDTREFAIEGAPLCLDDEGDSIQASTTTGSKVTIMLTGGFDA